MDSRAKSILYFEYEEGGDDDAFIGRRGASGVGGFDMRYFSSILIRPLAGRINL